MIKNIVVIEDEVLAAERLIALLHELDKEFVVQAQPDSVSSSVKWLSVNPPPDLIFMDIQLADGLCFEVFEKTSIDAPVIFTTAYNEYALKAFKVNSIDYLLKPIDKKELEAAIAKFKKVTASASKPGSIHPELLKQVMGMIQNPYKPRFVIRLGEHIKAIQTDDIALFYSNEKSTYLRTLAGRDFAMDHSLDQLEDETDPKAFFRVSRKYMVALSAIKDIIAYSGSRLKLIVTGAENEEVLVSREKVTDFKKWLEG
jgi:DNA-binding LytR/AlgR family response regulator